MHATMDSVFALCAVLGISAAPVASATAGEPTTGFSDLYYFCQEQNCADGQFPLATVVADSFGNLYGTTSSGGAYSHGEVYKVTSTGSESVLYSFCAQQNCTDGGYPVSNLTLDKAGNLYGTTEYGGASNLGAVFKLEPNGTETVLYSFQKAPDGNYPVTGVVMGKTGNLYGTTEQGGSNAVGTVFKLSPSGSETILHSFSGKPDGASPQADLLMKAGSLYGTTYSGGAYNGGTVFKVTKTGVETVLYSFCAQQNCSDGENPRSNLVTDRSGNLYGTTFNGGANASYAGTVFALNSGGDETVLYSFCAQQDCNDGYNPEGRIARDKSGNLYGSTSIGSPYHWGNTFKISGTAESVLYAFPDGPCSVPLGVILSKGYLYGASDGTGESDANGCVYKLGTDGGLRVR